jgi:hypothetical protein
MSDRTSRPIDLTLERINRLEQQLGALMDHQKSLATLMGAMARDVGNRADRMVQEVSEMRRKMDEVQRDVGQTQQELREVRIEQIEHMNQILNAIQSGFQAHQRLQELEGRLPPEPR